MYLGYKYLRKSILPSSLCAALSLAILEMVARKEKRKTLQE